MQDGRIAAFMAALLAERELPAAAAGPLVPVCTPKLARSLAFHRDVMDGNELVFLQPGARPEDAS